MWGEVAELGTVREQEGVRGRCKHGLLEQRRVGDGHGDAVGQIPRASAHQVEVDAQLRDGNSVVLGAAFTISAETPS